MNPGMMRNKVVFFTPSKSADGYGGFTSSGNSTSATFFAHAVEKSGKIETKDGKTTWKL